MQNLSVEDARQRGEDAHELIWKQLAGTEFASNDRGRLVLAYGSMVLEHQYAILNLVGLSIFGSAFALLRSEVEAMFRGLWVLKLASDPQLEGIAQRDEEPFPRFKEMATELDAAYDAPGLFTNIAQHWKVMNGYTHTGLHQLGRRFSEGNIKPDYSEDAVKEVLISSATIVIQMFVPIFRAYGFEDNAQVLEAFINA